jgi:YVTN family beta-propeller protein
MAPITCRKATAAILYTGKEVWAANSHDGTVSVIDVAKKAVVETLKVPTRFANRLKFTLDGKWVLISDLGGGELVVVDAAARKEAKRIRLGGGAAGILMHPDGSRAYVAVGFDNGTEKGRLLDGRCVGQISAQLAAAVESHTASILDASTGISFMGITPAGPFDIPEEQAIAWLTSPNPSGRPNSDVLRPYFNGSDLTKRARNAWTVDFGVEMPLETASRYEKPFGYLASEVKPVRQTNRRAAYAKNWWIYAESRPAMRLAFAARSRFLATCMVAKHRMFLWLDTVALPANVVIAFGRSDDFFFGILHCRFHNAWALKQGTRLETRPRYTPTTCFETFPFPRPTPEQKAAIAAAPNELNQLRERWLNPSEWTETRALEFPGSANGHWSRYVGPKTVDAKSGIGTVRYPRLEPRDARCAAKLKKRTLTSLYNERPAWLDLAHKKLDEAVAAAYDWPCDLTDDQILERLLALNLERAAEEESISKAKRRPASRGKREDELV